MFDLSLSEIALVLVASLILIGPKDIPVVVRNLAKWGRGIKSLVGEVKQAADVLIKDVGIDDVKRDLEEATAHFIVDDEGRRQRVYDITDMMTPKVIAPPAAPEEKP